MPIILSDKEQKKEFKIKAQNEPEKYYPTNILKKNGFSRKKCIKCDNFFWTAVSEKNTCGEPDCNDGFTVAKNNPSKHKLSYIDVWTTIVNTLEPRGYKPIKRYPSVARWNPTTEFTIASIAAFQPYVVSGEIPPPAKKLLIPQFCLRFSDIENVGITGSHCTGFVMIGQHQFVSPEEWDQDQAFQDIYDFLVDGVGLNKTEFVVHEDAWAGAGCFGPCMEFFSRGVELFNQVYTLFQQTPEGPIGLDLKVLDMGLGMERVAWFSQGTPNIYEAIFPNVLKKIRKITQVKLDFELYNRFSQYSAFLNNDEVENMDEAWKKVGKQLQINPEELKQKIIPMTGIYSIAEHARTLLFAITDGKLPSNVGGGYNLRVIFRRAISFIDQFHWDIDISEVCKWHAEELFDIFPEVSENLKEVKEILDVEKAKFYATKKEAENIVKRLVKKNEISEDKLIELYDSNGINPEIIKEEARKLGKKVVVPDDFYTKVIARHEKLVQIHATHKVLDIDVSELKPTQCLYYENYLDLELYANIVQIDTLEHEIEVEDKNDEIIIEKKTMWGIILDKTIAYPTSGGQIHDNCLIDDISIIDVIKIGKVIVHLALQKPSFSIGQKITLKIDKERRILLSQHHTATHIVNAAAKKVLGNHINQAGAKKTLKKAHLDITHYESISDDKLYEIEVEANNIIQQSIKSKNRFMDRSDAELKYGMSLYQGGAVPGKKLRIVEIPGIDVEACGGTHVNNTKEIGTIVMIKSQKIQDGIVRLTYTAGNAAEQKKKENIQIKREIGKILDVSPENIVFRVEELIEKWRLLRKAKSNGIVTDDMLELKKIVPNPRQPLLYLLRMLEVAPDMLISKIKKHKLEWDEMKEKITYIAEAVGEKNIKKMIIEAKVINGVKFVSQFYQNFDNKILVNIAKNLLKHEKNILIFLVGNSERGINVIAMRGEKINQINLSKIMKTFLVELNGKGGGKPDSAQGFIENFDLSPENLIPIFEKVTFS